MKPLFIISCPIDTYSGYGARSRDLVKSIIELNKYDVKVLPQRWGNCPWNFIEENNDEWGFLTSHLLPPGNSIPQQPEIWAQVTVPNEFSPVGKYNIGFTAGIETTRVDPSWIEGINRMDLNLVSSNHSKEVFLNSKYEKRDQNTNQILSLVEVNKPIEVLFEGVNLEKYFPKKSNFDLSQIKEDFAYLFLGHWMQGALGEDRKNVGLLVQLFLESFKNKKKSPALILKCSGAGSSYMDRNEMIRRIEFIRSKVKDAKTLPNIYLLHGDFTDQEINELYNHKKVKAMVSLTKGEGFGRPLIEFSLTKKPIIATNWSGHTDFLHEDFSTLIGGELKQVHQSAVVNNIILSESEWFAPNLQEVIYHFKDMFENYKGYKELAVRQAFKSKNEFSFDGMKSKIDSYLTNAVPEFPKQVQIQLPNVTKINKPPLKKVNS